MPTTFHFAFYQVAWDRRIAVPLEPRVLHIMQHDTASYLCALPSSVPAEVAVPSKRGPSAFILACLIKLSSTSP